MAYVAFFVSLCYHTPYARPWIYAPLALYGFDLCLRLFKYRVKDPTVEAVSNQMTLVRSLVPCLEMPSLTSNHHGFVFSSAPMDVSQASAFVCASSSPAVSWNRILSLSSPPLPAHRASRNRWTSVVVGWSSELV